MTIYITMTLAVLTIELMHRTSHKYPSVKEWISQRWDNWLASFVSGVLLCLVFPEACKWDIVQGLGNLCAYQMSAGLVIGLSSTPLINLIKSKTKGRIEKAKKED